MHPDDLSDKGRGYDVIYPPHVGRAGFGSILEQHRDGNQPDRLSTTTCAQPRHFVTTSTCGQARRIPANLGLRLLAYLLLMTERDEHEGEKPLLSRRAGYA